MALVTSKRKAKKSFLKKKWFSGFFPLALIDGLKRQQLLSIGSALTVFLLLSPLIVWLSYNPSSIENPFIALAKINAFLAISSLSLNFLLSARLKALEQLFRGLDRMYRVHKVVGRTSLFFMILHPVFLVIATRPQLSVLIEFILPIGSIDVAAGVIAVYLFLFLIVLTVAIHIPYHWWHISHKFLGFVLLFAGGHALFAGSDIAQYDMLRFWITFLISLGMVSWAYMTFFYKHIGPRFKVSLSQVNHRGDITEVYFKKPRGFSYQPGQFIFIRFPRFEGVRELFPFSISSDPSQSSVRISIRQSGDYTSKSIPLLKKGDPAIVMGPYGRFGERYLSHEYDMVWIAGGIGITPFLSLAKHESIHPTKRKILLIWARKEKQDPYDKELEFESLKNSHFEFIAWVSEERKRLTADDIMYLVGGKAELKRKYFFLCGPPAMMYQLSHRLHKLGVSYHHIAFEDFNMLD